MLRSRFVWLGVALLLATLSAAVDAGATPLLAMQAASRCDTCHVMPDRTDPKWVEENTPLADRRCRATCGACHVNPTGGMLRTSTGNYFGDRSLTLKRGVGPSLERGLSLVRSNPFLTLGGDFRFMESSPIRTTRRAPSSSRCGATSTSVRASAPTSPS